MVCCLHSKIFKIFKIKLLNKYKSININKRWNKMAFYSEKVMDHFANPRNVGEIKDASGVGEVGNPVCGDMMKFYIKVENNIIKDVKFKTFGCGAAIAVSSMVSEMAMGKTIEEALALTNEAVAKELGGLPPNKMHCSNLGADALHKAIEDYKQKLSK
jgi:nitrogen fixation NifU-like protein